MNAVLKVLCFVVHYRATLKSTFQDEVCLELRNLQWEAVLGLRGTGHHTVANLRMFLAQVYSVSLLVAVFCALSFVFVEIMSAYCLLPVYEPRWQSLIVFSDVSLCLSAFMQNC